MSFTSGNAAARDASPSRSTHGTGLRVGDRNSGTLSLRQAGRQLSRAGSRGEIQRGSAETGTHQQARQRVAQVAAGGKQRRSRCAVSRSGAAKFFHLAMRRGRKIAKVAMARKPAVHLYWMWRQGWNYGQLQKLGSHAREPGSL